MSTDAQEQVMERLRRENEELKKQLQCKAKSLSLKVGPKGGVCVYGLGRFPISLYRDQWLSLLDFEKEIRDFIEEHDDELAKKE